MKKKKKNKPDNSMYPNKEMEKEATNNVSQNTKEASENAQLTSEVETEEIEKDSQVHEASVINSNNVKEKIESFRRNKSLCRIAAATVSVIVAVVAICVLGSSFNIENRNDISLVVCADTTFAKALQSKDSFKMSLKDTIRLQKDSTVTIATIQKISSDQESASTRTEHAPLDLHLAVKVKPAENMLTTKALGFSKLLFCVILSLLVYIVAYNMIIIKKMPELCALLNAKNTEELEEKIKKVKDDDECKQEKIKELNQKISAKEKELEDASTLVSRLQYENRNLQNENGTSGHSNDVILIEDIRGIKSFNDILDKESVLQRINELVDSEQKGQRLIKFLNMTLQLGEPVSLDNYEFIGQYINAQKGEEAKGTGDLKVDFDHFVRDYGSDNVKTIWKECGKDEKRFFEEVANRLKPLQEYTEKDFLRQLKLNGFDDLIVVNTTVKSLWDKVRSHFEQLKKESEKALTEQKNNEIAMIKADLNSLKEESEKLLEKIKTRAKNDFSVNLAETDNASLAFDTFCNEFKELKNELSVISKLKELLDLHSGEAIDKSTVKNDIKDAVARELIIGCSCLEGIEHYDGIKPRLCKISSQIEESKKLTDQAENRIEDEKVAINDAYKVVFGSELVADNMEDGFSKFKDKAKETIDGLKGNVADKEEKIKTANGQIADQNIQIEKLGSEVMAKKEQIKNYGYNFVIRLQQDVSSIMKTVRDNKFLGATLKDGGFATKLDIIYGKVENGSDQLLERASLIANELKAKEDVQPEDMLQKVQDLLKREIDKPSGFINLIAQYYAYSRLPFMSDQNAEYGLQFNRAGIKKIYEVVVQMLADFNITLQVPALYAEYDKDWEYENVTGQAQKGLDFLIPDAANHVYKVDNSSKEGLILDFSEVGYTIDGQVEKQTKIIL